MITTIDRMLKRSFSVDTFIKDYEEELEYKSFAKDLDKYENTMLKGLSEIVERMKEQFYYTLKKKDVFNKPDEAKKLQLKYVGNFKEVLRDYLVKLHLDSKLNALRLLVKQGVDIQISTNFAEIPIQPWEPVPPEEALDFFRRKVLARLVTSDGVKKLITLAVPEELDYYNERAFYIAGVERDFILNNAKDVIGKVIAGDITRDEGMFELEMLFNRYIQDSQIERDTGLVSMSRLETIIRTNETEAINRGRKIMFDNPDVEDFVPYIRYRAITDTRTRETHRAMHNRIYKKNNPIWEKISPPAGFNCRCFIVPVTSFEKVEESNEDLPAGFPDEGFK